MLFGVRRSVRYHARRRAFFENWNTVTQAIGVLFGSLTIGGALKEGYAPLAVASGALVTFFSTVNLVVGTTRKARQHEELGKRFVQLEREIVEAAEYDESRLAKFLGQRLQIEADEPPVLKVLDCICHNELARAMGHGDDALWRVGPIQRLARHFFDFREHALRPVKTT